jgi:hypothetical protein
MDESCGTQGDIRITQRIFVGGDETVVLFGRPGHRWKDVSCRNSVGHTVKCVGHTVNLWGRGQGKASGCRTKGTDCGLHKVRGIY